MKAFTVLALVLSQIVAINAYCQIGIPVNPPDSTVTINFIPTNGNCAGLESPENAFVDPLGVVYVQCTTRCAFTLESDGDLDYNSATGNCTFTPDGFPIPVYATTAQDCHGNCACETTGDFQTFNLLRVPNDEPNPDCAVTFCAPEFEDGYNCPLPSPYIVDTNRCGVDVDAQILTTCLSCSTGLPSPVGLFSLFVTEGNLNVGEFCTDIQGRVAVAGDANWCNAIGDQIAGPNTNNIGCLQLIDYLCDFPWAVVVGGTLNASGAIYGGDVWANATATFQLSNAQKAKLGDKKLPQMLPQTQRLAGRADPKSNLLGAHLNKESNLDAIYYQCLTFGPPTTPNPIDFGAMAQLLRDYLFVLNSQTRTGDTSVAGPVVKFRGTNTPGTEVFHLPCLAMGPQTHNVEIENINPNVQAIIINVFCYDSNPLLNKPWNLSSVNGFDMGALEPFQSRIIWGVDADNVSLANVGFRGTLLAPYAAVDANNGNFVGAVIARDYRGTYQFNLPLWAGCPSIVFPPQELKETSTTIRPSRRASKKL